MLAPHSLLHWVFCEWGFADPPQQTFDPTSAAVSATQLDYYTRINMLHRFGFSQGLPTLLPWIRDRYVQHIDIYKTVVRRFVRTAQLHRLTNQPRRDGTLDRYAGFQYIDQSAGAMLVALFRPPGATPKRRSRLPGIAPPLSSPPHTLPTHRPLFVPALPLHQHPAPRLAMAQDPQKRRPARWGRPHALPAPSPTLHRKQRQAELRSRPGVFSAQMR